jgi:hypothetical protein
MREVVGEYLVRIGATVSCGERLRARGDDRFGQFDDRRGLGKVRRHGGKPSVWPLGATASG